MELNPFEGRKARSGEPVQLSDRFAGRALAEPVQLSDRFAGCALGGLRRVSNIYARALDAHTLMRTQALNSEAIQSGLKDILLNHAQLWEALRATADVGGTGAAEP